VKIRIKGDTKWNNQAHVDFNVFFRCFGIILDTCTWHVCVNDNTQPWHVMIWSSVSMNYLHVDFTTLNNRSVWILTKRAPSLWVESLSRKTDLYDKDLWLAHWTWHTLRSLSPRGGWAIEEAQIPTFLKRAGGKKEK